MRTGSAALSAVRAPWRCLSIGCAWYKGEHGLAVLYIKFTAMSERSGDEHNDHSGSWEETPATVDAYLTRGSRYDAITHSIVRELEIDDSKAKKLLISVVEIKGFCLRYALCEPHDL